MQTTIYGIRFRIEISMCGKHMENKSYLDSSKQIPKYNMCNKKIGTENRIIFLKLQLCQQSNDAKAVFQSTVSNIVL